MSDQPPIPPRVDPQLKKRRDRFVYATVGFEPHMYRAIDNLNFKGFRGFSGTVRYLVKRGLDIVLEEKRNGVTHEQ